MNLTINGEKREIDDGTSIASLLDAKGLRAEMVVVERNGQIVPRIDYAGTTLTASDNLEIVQMMAGG
jgi:thiamine biosynthesis protein ThiS